MRKAVCREGRKEEEGKKEKKERERERGTIHEHGTVNGGNCENGRSEKKRAEAGEAKGREVRQSGFP